MVVEILKSRAAIADFSMEKIVNTTKRRIIGG
jgi:hypothetical protein